MRVPFEIPGSRRQIRGDGLQVDTRVYDYTTHALVGAYRVTDFGVPCGGSQALLIMSGIIPGPECQSAKVAAPCIDAGSGDGGLGEEDASRDDADGGCTCEPDERQGGGTTSLTCFCARAGCLSYDQALTSCYSDAPPEWNRIEDYEACNLVVMTSGSSIPGGSSHVFDRTTHELVGAASGFDYPAFRCGDASVFGISAGTYPPSGCTPSRNLPRCPRPDGG